MSGGRLKYGLFVVVGLALIMALALAAPVGAIPPDREPIPIAEPLVIRGACAFDVLVEELVQKEKGTTFYDQDGNAQMTIFTGALKVRLTNLSSGGSLELNISGPGRYEPQADGRLRITSGGPWLWWGVPGVAELQSLVLTRGRLDVLFDGVTVEVVSMSGSVVDLCGVLGEI